MSKMGCYHFHLNQLSRGKGQSAIASAAYRAGTKLECTYYGEVSDYTRKGGVVLAEIHLPKQAPERFKDREILWNEVEWIEGNKKAQLAHSFDITLMNEFSMEENIELARRFVEEQLVARGMIADLAIHDPKKAKDKIPNPHMHIMVPIRPLKEDGTWGQKQKKVPVLTPDGQPVLNQKGQLVFRAVHTTDWSRKETLKKHSRQCACDRKAYEEEQKYFKDKEHRELVNRNTSICFDESRMEEWTFENADMSDAVMHKAKNYVDNWDEMKRNHIGCLFWGPVGTGKSYIAGCIANELLKQEVTVKMTNFNTIIDDIFPLADKTEYINALASYQLLIIDDLGVERNSEYALGIIFSVIDRRIRSGRPLIITTNLPLKEIKNETMLDKRRIYDRILEMCTPMYVGGTSKREAIASMKMEKAKTLLNTNRGEEECE